MHLVPKPPGVRIVTPTDFDLDEYLDLMAPYVAEFFRRRHTVLELYNLLRSAKTPLPVGYSAFRRGAARFRKRVQNLSTNQRQVLDGKMATMFPQAGDFSAPPPFPCILPDPEPRPAETLEEPSDV